MSAKILKELRECIKALEKIFPDIEDLLKACPVLNGSVDAVAIQQWMELLTTKIKEWRTIFKNEFKGRYAANPRVKRVNYANSDKYITDKTARRQHYRNEEVAIHQLLDKFSKRTRCYTLYVCIPPYYGQIESSNSTVFWSKPLNLLAPDICNNFYGVVCDLCERVESQGRFFANMEMSNNVAMAVHKICKSVTTGSINEDSLRQILAEHALSGLQKLAEIQVFKPPSGQQNDDSRQYIGSAEHVANMAYYNEAINGGGRRRGRGGANGSSDVAATNAARGGDANGSSDVAATNAARGGADNDENINDKDEMENVNDKEENDEDDDVQMDRYGDQNHNHNFRDRVYHEDGTYEENPSGPNELDNDEDDEDDEQDLVIVDEDQNNDQLDTDDLNIN